MSSFLLFFFFRHHLWTIGHHGLGIAILMTSGHLLHDKEEPGVTTLQQAVLSIFSLFF